ncbi:ABC transporter substrate-binding protein [Bifidobacterium goeldii]|uniref:ABC transporter substrate-binding protein n=1 Tax=Bifidobacterium goeldii TaxID=2306975 RepID=A0A430FFZ5_9BIFI|nr:ABC transporter substrate-binding protein [Bifidobacterium goeldii]RSX51701.1 ABC transporter substrate-binding protein [Bifidobacterium goeldii]
MSYSKGIRCATAAALSAAMIMSFAACGTTDEGDSNSSADGNSSTSSSTKGFDTSSIKKDDAIAALLPDSVAGDGTLTVGTDTSYAPAEFLAEDGKTAVGFDVDLSKAIAAVFGLKEETISSTFDSIIPSVGSKYDIGISSFTVTPERMDAVDFVTYFKAGSTWVVRKGNPDNVDTSNLCGVKVAVQTGTTQEEEVNKANEQCKADGKDAIDIQSSKLQTDVTTAVASGKASIFYADSPVAGYAISQTGDTLETLGDDTGVTPEAVAIKKGDSATAQAVQKAIQKLMDDGTYDKILSTWGVESGALDKAEINPTVE